MKLDTVTYEIPNEAGKKEKRTEVLGKNLAVKLLLQMHDEPKLKVQVKTTGA